MPILKKLKLSREREHKFGIDLAVNIESLVDEASSLAEKNGWKPKSREESNRAIRYFDIIDTYILALRNQTIREVTRYDILGNIQSIRYDYKTGNKKRFEAS